MQCLQFVINLVVCKETDKLGVLENINKIKTLERKELLTETQHLEEICEVTDFCASTLKNIRNEFDQNNGEFSTPGTALIKLPYQSWIASMFRASRIQLKEYNVYRVHVDMGYLNIQEPDSPLEMAIKRTPSNDSCIFGACPNQTQIISSNLFKAKILYKHNLYISPETRACVYHLRPEQNWEEVAEAEDNLTDFNVYHIQDIVNIMKTPMEIVKFMVVSVLD